MNKLVPADAILIPSEAKRVFEGTIFDVYQWPQQLFDGSVATFEMLKRPDTVVACCIVDDKILVLHDEQPHRGTKRCFPGGRVEPQESTLAAAEREVREETGYTFTKWRLVQVEQPLTKIEWFVYLYVAWDPIAQTDVHLDGGERTSVELLDLEEFRHVSKRDPRYFEGVQVLLKQATTLADILSAKEFIGTEIAAG